MRDLHLDRLVALLHVSAAPSRSCRRRPRRGSSPSRRSGSSSGSGPTAGAAAGRRACRPHPTARCRSPTSPCGDAAAAIGHREVQRSFQIASTAVASLPFTRGMMHSSRKVAIDFMPGRNSEQIAHAGDAAGGLDVDDEDVARRPERMALEPRIVGPGHAQHRHAHVADGHVGIVIGVSCLIFDARREGDYSGAFSQRASRSRRCHPGSRAAAIRDPSLRLRMWPDRSRLSLRWAGMTVHPVVRNR